MRRRNTILRSVFRLRLIACIICISLLAGSLTGCTLYEQIEETISIIMDGELGEDYDYTAVNITPEEPPVIDVSPLPKSDDGPEVDEQVIVIDDGQDEDTDTDTEAGTEDEEAEPSTDALSDITLDEMLKAERYYAYHTLRDDEKKIYKLIYNSLMNFEGKTPMPTKDPKAIDNVFSCVLADNPELFYIRGYNLIRYERGGVIEKLYLTGLFTMTKADAAVHKERADAYVEKCLADAPQGTDDYEKIKYLYEYIVKNTEYDLDAENGQNFLSVFENGRSVCQGYATAMQYMMNKLGLFCIVVRGVTNNNENHAWNLVKSDGDYYFVDVTWGDSSFDVKTDRWMASLPQLPEVSYEYLCVTTSDIEPTHRLENYFTVPECTARKDNYFIREGNYFESVDDARLHAVFDKAYSQGDSIAVIKCSDPTVYSAMTDYLTGSGNVFNYLRDSRNVNYVTLDSLNEMIFYL